MTRFISTISSRLLALALICLASPAWATTRLSIASNDISNAATWATIEANSFVNNNATTVTLTTSFGPAGPTTFTVAGTTTASGLGVKLACVANAAGTVASPCTGTLAGTLTCQIETGGTQVTNAVTGAIPITNASFQPASSATNDDGGWVYMAFASNATLATSTNYAVQCKTSSSNQIALQAATSTSLSVIVYTSTTAAAASGDILFVGGNWSGGGSPALTSLPVTIPAGTLPASGSYGSVSNNTTATPAISVSQGGTLCLGSGGTCGPTTSATYAPSVAGVTVIYTGGNLNIGTSGLPVPGSSTATLAIAATGENQSGIEVKNGGTYTTNGSPRTSAKLFNRTYLFAASSTNWPATTTSLPIHDDTGWLSGDTVVVANTALCAGNQSNCKDESIALTGNESGKALPVGGGTAQAHAYQVLDYTSASTGKHYQFNGTTDQGGTNPDVILLTYNVNVNGGSASNVAWIHQQSGGNVAIAWTGHKWIGGTTNGNLGFESDVGAAGSLSITYSMFQLSRDGGMNLARTNGSFGGVSGTPALIQHVVMYQEAQTSGRALTIGVTSNPFWKIDDLTIIHSANSSQAMFVNALNGQFSNIHVNASGTGDGGVLIYLPGSQLGDSTLGGVGAGNVWGPLSFYANSAGGGASGDILWSTGGINMVNGVINGLYIWADSPQKFSQSWNVNFIEDPFMTWGVTDGGIYLPTAGLTVRNGFIAGSAAVSMANGLQCDETMCNVTYENMEMCPQSTQAMSDSSTPFTGCANSSFKILADNPSTPGMAIAQVVSRNTSLLSPLDLPFMGDQFQWSNSASIINDCSACTIPHAAYLPGGTLTYDNVIAHTAGGFSVRMNPGTLTLHGAIAGTTLTVYDFLSQNNVQNAINYGADFLSSATSGFVNGTAIISNLSGTAGGIGTYGVNISQTTGSTGSPAAFQGSPNGGAPTSLYAAGTPFRLQSAPLYQGQKISVKATQTSGNVCVWVRQSTSTDAAPPWAANNIVFGGYISIASTDNANPSTLTTVGQVPAWLTNALSAGATINVSQNGNVPANTTVSSASGTSIHLNKQTGGAIATGVFFSQTSGGVTYTGDLPRLILRANPQMNIQVDTVKATAANSPGTWQQICDNSPPTAPQDGAYEYVVDADQTATSNPGGWVNVADWSCGTNNCQATGWYNGTAVSAITSSSSGGGSGSNHVGNGEGISN